MFYASKTNFFSFQPQVVTNLAPAVQKVFLFSSCCYTTSSKTRQPVLFDHNLKSNFISKKRKILFKLKSERGNFAPHHKLKQTFDEGVSAEEKEYLSADRSNFLIPNFFYNLFMHTGREYKPIRGGSFKTVLTARRGYDYYTNYSRNEDTFSYQDPIFQFKKSKLGEYIFTKRCGSIMHYIKKKK
jgi:hypothetical protein